MRTDSIYSRLERADRKAATTHFLDLMIFLEEAEGDKFGKAAALVKDTWGFKTSKSSLAEGYGVARSLWRLGRASSFAQATEHLSTFEPETRRVVSQQTFQVLASPDLDPKVLLGFAKLEVAKLQTDARLKGLKSKTDLGLDALFEEIKGNEKALALFQQMKAALKKK